jgi:hypothetical protein
MPETTAPRPSTTPAGPRPSANGTAPLVPSESTKAHMRIGWLGAVDRFRMAMTPLRRMMRRTARRA